MSFLIYQRSDPRCQDWTPLVTQQVRLRNVIQIIGLNLEVKNDEDEIYFTLHDRATSAPFFTSEKLKAGKRVLTWKEIEPRQFGESVRLSAPGCIVRVWPASAKVNTQEHLMSWCVYFTGLRYLGSKGDWNTRDFSPNTLLFRMPFGFFTPLDCLAKPPISSPRYLQIQTASSNCRESYTVKRLAALHGVQRSVLDEAELAFQLKGRISLFGYSTELDKENNISVHHNLILSEKALLRVQQGKTKIQLKEFIESSRQRITVLKEEKQRLTQRCNRLKLEKSALGVEEMGMDLLSRMQTLAREKDRLREYKFLVQEKRHFLTQQCSKLFLRRKQLISELLLIYPLNLVEGSKRISVNEVQLPNAEDYGSEVGGQISVALGYTAHLVAMLSFFLGIPLRYPIRHFGSRSRIVDHITVQIPDKEREFPLYFASKEDVYSKYAVYLLNKNIAQLRWYCGLSTSDLRASLPNLHNLLTTRLTIPGWPPSPSESLEMAQELTEEVDQQLRRSEFSISLDKGLDKLDPPQKTFENQWIRTSISNFECAGGNAVPAGEVKHGKAQDRFLNGWRKKTYESEVIDPNWLTNSLNLEFDGGRRLSTISNPSSLLRPPSILVSEEEKDGPRKRRYGRVENTGTQMSLKTSKPVSPEPILYAGETPNENLSQLENHIKLLERRRSFCGEGGRNSGEGSPSPTLANTIEANLDPMSPSTEIEKDEVHDREADLVRRMSLVEMRNRRKVSRETMESISTHPEGLVEEDSTDMDTLHLVTNYDHSSDERGTPSPSLQNTSPSQMEDLKAQHQVESLSNILVPETVKEKRTSESLSSEITSSSEVPSSTINSQEAGDADLHLNDNISNECDSDSNFENTSSSPEEEALWLRNEALEALLNSQSFNQVKRRVSETK